MRLSREKTVRLSHIITDVLVVGDDVEFIEDRATIRQNIVEILLALLKEEEQMDAQVRQKIASQKKEIAEGSASRRFDHSDHHGPRLEPGLEPRANAARLERAGNNRRT